MATLDWQLSLDDAAWAVKARAQDFLKGHVALEPSTVAGEDGWVRPLRFTAEQARALASVAAWHPALYKSQARSTAGVCLEIVTAASAVAVEVARDQGYARVGDESADVACDGYSIDVDDVHVEGVLDTHDQGYLVVDLGDESAKDAPRTLRIWLPAFSGCRLRMLLATANVEAAPKRRSLLVLGDSIAQGQGAHDPGLSWAADLTRAAHLDVVNQGLLRQIYQPSALSPLAGEANPDFVWVAYGGAYRFEECYEGAVERDIRASLGVVRRAWRDRPTWLATPTPHDETARPSNGRSCWQAVPGILERISCRWPQFTLVDGDDLLDAETSLFADADHPNVLGHAQMAERIGRVLAGEEPITSEERQDRSVPQFLRDMMHRRSASVSAAEGVEVVQALAPEAEVIAEAEPVAESEEPLEVGETMEEVVVIEPEAEVEPEAQLECENEAASEPEAIEVEEEAEVAEEPGAPADATAVLDAREIRERLVQPATSRGTSRVRDEDIDAVLDLMSEGPLDSVPMEQIVERGLGRFTYASEGFATVDLPDGTRYFWGDDVIEAKRAMARQTRPSLAVILSPELEGIIRRVFPTKEVSLPYKLMVYEGTEPIPVESSLDIRVLAPSWATVIKRSYSYPDGASAAEIAHLLAKGRILGGFDRDNQLVGFIGEHPDGALGMLEVFPRARRRGFGSALLAVKANEHLAMGWTPYSQIMGANEGSLALHEAVGFTTVPTVQLYIPMEA